MAGSPAFGASAMATVNQDIRVKIDAILNGLPQVQAFTGALKVIKTQGNTKLNFNTSGAEKGLLGVTNLIRNLSPEADNLLRKVEGLSGGMAGIAGPAGIATVAIGALTVGVIGLGVGIFGLLQKFAETGSKLFDFKETTGLTAETVSTLAYATQQGGKDLDSMGAGVKKFTSLIADAARGSEEATAKLRGLGIDPKKAINDLDGALAQAFKRINEGKPGLEQMTLAADAFGKRSGPDLIATIKTMNGDLPEFIEHAKKLGVTLGEEDLKAADDFGDTLDLLKAQAAGVANQFSAELAPDVVRAMQDISGSMGDNQSTARSWGRDLADIFRGLRTIAESELGTLLKFLWEVNAATGGVVGAMRLVGMLGASSRGEAPVEDPWGPGGAARGGRKSLPGTPEWKATQRRLGNSDTDILSPRGGGGGGKRGAGGKKRSIPDVMESIFGFNREQAESAFALVKDQIERQQEALEESFADREISIRSFYAEQLRVQTAATDAEIAKLEKLRAIEQDRFNRAIAKIQNDKEITSEQERSAKLAIENNRAQKEFLRLDTDIELKQRERLDIAEELARKETDATRKLQDGLQAVINEIDRFRGLGPLVQAREEIGRLDVQIQELRNNGDDFGASLLEEFRELLGVLGQVEAAFSRFQAQQELNEAKIATLREKGRSNLVEQFIGEQQINAIRREQLQLAKEALELAEAAAQRSKDPSVLAALERQREAVARLKNEYRTLSQTIKDTFLDSAVGGIEEFLMSLDEVAAGTMTLTEAFRTMALSIIEELQRIIAKMIALQIIAAAMKIFGGGASGTASSGAGALLGAATGAEFSAQPGGRIIRVAEGGHDEMVVSTDPRYAMRSAKLLGRFIRRTGILPAFAQGGFTSDSILGGIADRLPRFAMGDFVTPDFATAAAGGSVSLQQNISFPGVKDYRSFKQNETAIKRDLGRAAEQGIRRIRGSR